MPLTRDFKDTVMARAQRDPRFSKALFTEALNAYLSGEPELGRALLRDLINATVGFEALAEITRIAPKSLHRMLAAKGNPTTRNFFGIVTALQQETRVRLRVSPGPPSPAYRVSEKKAVYRTAGKRSSARMHEK